MQGIVLCDVPIALDNSLDISDALEMVRYGTPARSFKEDVAMKQHQ